MIFYVLYSRTYDTLKDIIKSCLFSLGIIMTFILFIWLLEHGITFAGDYLKDHASIRNIAVGASLTVISALIIAWLSVLVANHRKEMTEDGVSRED